MTNFVYVFWIFFTFSLPTKGIPPPPPQNYISRKNTAYKNKVFCRTSEDQEMESSLPMKTKKELYNALVVPYLDYRSIVWQECSKEQVQRKECKLWDENNLVKTTKD